MVCLRGRGRIVVRWKGALPGHQSPSVIPAKGRGVDFDLGFYSEALVTRLPILSGFCKLPDPGVVEGQLLADEGLSSRWEKFTKNNFPVQGLVDD